MENKELQTEALPCSHYHTLKEYKALALHCAKATPFQAEYASLQCQRKHQTLQDHTVLAKPSHDLIKTKPRSPHPTAGYWVWELEVSRSPPIK